MTTPPPTADPVEPAGPVVPAGPPVRLAAPGRWLGLVAVALLGSGAGAWVLAGGRLAELLP